MSKILDGVLREFEQLAAIPRPSKHEGQVSDFLRDYLKNLGVTVAQDSCKNIIAEIPATAGKESAPLTILQAHMDMVCVAEAGYPYEPLTDSIKLIRTENFLEAEGTSLGADDGIGVAAILYIVKNIGGIEHGPLRVIFTVDEEQGMSGAMNIDAQHFTDAAFLINCDSEIFEEIVAGSAGSVRVDFSRRINYVKPRLPAAFKIDISGLIGGHSGIEIIKNRANAIKIAENLLGRIHQDSEIRLAKFDGGTATNVIPNAAEIVIAAELTASEIARHGQNLTERVKKIYGEDLKIEVTAIEQPAKVFSAEDFSSLMNLISVIHSGVYAVRGDMPLTSANIGIVRTGENITVKVLPRSNVTELIDDFKNLFVRIGELTGFEVNFGTTSPAWDYNPQSRLTEIVSKIFKEQNGFDAKIHTSHGGLECSFFMTKNPQLDIVSIGTTNENIHSPKERLHLKTVEPHVRLIIETLAQISAQ